MTNEKAIKLIKTQHDLYDVVAGDWSFARKAIEALEKQIPKKPIEEWCGPIFSEDKGYKTLHKMCPSCKKLEVCKMDIHCPRCGQAIDWSDEE